MHTVLTDRGFQRIIHDIYPQTQPSKVIAQAPLVSESSVILNYEDSIENPGSSALWLGSMHHLNREEVRQLADALEHWLTHKSLPEIA